MSEKKYEEMWIEYTYGRLPIEKWLAFCEKYRKYLNDTYVKESGQNQQDQLIQDDF